MTTRRRQILDTAAVLFAERGFHGVTVDEIGAAVGISGPGLYKHFAGKGELLSASLSEISQTLLDEGRARVAAATSDREALDSLIAWHIDFALDHPDRIVIQDREWGNLDDAGRTAVRERQRAYVDVWVDVLRRLRPSLDQPTARASVQATFGLINSTPHSARIARSAMQDLLADMARSALLP